MVVDLAIQASPILQDLHAGLVHVVSVAHLVLYHLQPWGRLCFMAGVRRCALYAHRQEYPSPGLLLNFLQVQS